MLPSVAAVLALSLIGGLVQIPVIVFYSKIKNIPVVFIAGWYFIICCISFISILVWGNDDLENWWNGYVFCDIVVRLQIGYNTGVICATCAVARNLARLLSNDGPQLNYNSFSARMVDLAICIIMPVVLMGLVYIVQVRRYIIYQYQGCSMPITSWVRIPLMLIWPTVWSIIASAYVIFTLYRYRLKRKDMGDLLHCAGSNMTRIQMIRFVSCCIIIILTILPLSIYGLVTNIQNQVVSKYSWTGIHDPILWGVIFKVRADGPSLAQYTDIPLSLVTFLFFGTSKESNAWYGELFDSSRRICLGIKDQAVRLWWRIIQGKYNKGSKNSMKSRLVGTNTVNVRFGGPAQSFKRFSPAPIGFGPKSLQRTSFSEEAMAEMDWAEMMELRNVNLTLPRSPDSEEIAGLHFDGDVGARNDSITM